VTVRPFRFGLQASNASSAAEWTTIVRRAEELGYSAVHLADHYLGPGAAHAAQGLAAIPAMAAAAAVTETIRVGCRVFCIDFHVPAVLAKEVATIELLSDGRLELGLGAGWVGDEYAAMGVPFDRAGVRIDRLEEVVALMKAYFAGEDLEIDGSHVHVHGYRGAPEPLQRPRPPIMIGGGAQRILTFAGRAADIVSLNFNNRAGVVGPDGVQSSTAERTDERIAWVREGAGDRFDEIELEVAAYFAAVTDDADAAAESFGARFGVEPSVMRSHPNALIGSVEEICEELQVRRDRFGISYVTISDRNREAFAPVVERLTGV
jgi:probable F420-dependent oxidoreductase